MRGTLINASLILVGSLVGMVVHRRLSANLAQSLVQGIGLFVLYLGAEMAASLRQVQQPLWALAALTAGTWIGGLLRLEERLQALGRKAEARFGGMAAGSGRFARAFITASLLFVVGPMAIVGSIQDGSTGDYRILLTKGVIDGTTAIAFASTLGPGVAASSLAVLVYQGAISLGAGLFTRLVTEAALQLLTGTGGLLIVGLGLNMVGVAKLPVANMLPSLFFALLLPAIVDVAL
ncbi:MAG: DUF554 domain-containing protein [Limnochordales bacterium]|nr:DUF554 domain-containing protein [Limnochordales bacterium]